MGGGLDTVATGGDHGVRQMNRCDGSGQRGGVVGGRTPRGIGGERSGGVGDGSRSVGHGSVRCDRGLRCESGQSLGCGSGLLVDTNVAFGSVSVGVRNISNLRCIIGSVEGVIKAMTRPVSGRRWRRHNCKHRTQRRRGPTPSGTVRRLSSSRTSTGH